MKWINYLCTINVIEFIIMTLNLKIGSPVVGDDFFGRKAELRKAELLIESNNLMLAAPRRVGKTSFARRLMEVQEAKGWNTVFIDLEEITSVDHFFKAFHDELMKLPETSLTDKVTAKMKKWFSKMELSSSGLPIKAVVKVGSSDNDDFKELADVLNMLTNHTLIVFDELTVLLKSLLEKDGSEKAARTFLNQFRALRMATSEKCSWLICSSIGVRNFATQYNVSDTINDVADCDLGAFSDAEATEFVSILSESLGIEISAKTKRFVLDKIGWNIPFFIQLLMSKLSSGKVTNADINEAYDHLLQTGAFDTWHERLNLEYGKNKEVAKLALKYLCVNNIGKTRDEIFNHTNAKFPEFEYEDFGLLLRALMKDGYLVKDGERFRFRSPLLRDYWKETYC